MTHSVDGFDLRFTSRRGWKAERRLNGRSVDFIPVTWTKGLHRDNQTGETMLSVWYRNDVERSAAAAASAPFIVALAEAKDYEKFPHDFKRFCEILEVRATGRILDDYNIETRVVGRVQAYR